MRQIDLWFATSFSQTVEIRLELEFCPDLRLGLKNYGTITIGPALHFGPMVMPLRSMPTPRLEHLTWTV